MGYALFAQRKILLTDRVNNLQLDLVQVSNKMSKLEQLGTAVADGHINAMELAQCQEAGLALSYEIGKDGKLALAKTSPEYLAGRAMLESENDKQYGGSKIGNGVCGAGLGAVIGGVVAGPIGAIAGGLLGGFVADKASAKSQAKNEQIKEYNNAFDETQIANIIEDITEDIAKMQNKLDKEKATLETRLTAAQSELESVKQQEGQAIQNSTPQYGGVA